MDMNAVNSCDPSNPNGAPPGGASYSCDDNVPFVIDDYTAYGFAAAPTDSMSEQEICCACYEWIFKNPPLQGKRMIVQATNVGQPGELNYGHFDFGLPGMLM